MKPNQSSVTLKFVISRYQRRKNIRKIYKMHKGTTLGRWRMNRSRDASSGQLFTSLFGFRQEYLNT